MINSKIDKLLFGQTLALGSDKKITCLVSASAFNQLKKVLKKQNIEILNEYLFIKSFLISATKQQIMFLARHTSVKFLSSNTCALALMNVSL